MAFAAGLLYRWRSFPPLDDGSVQILLANDTGATPNPGCRAVMHALNALLRSAGPATQVTATLPVGYWSERFAALAPPRARRAANVADRLPAAATEAGAIDAPAWRRLGKQALAADRELQALFARSEMLLVNGEGTLHHNQPRALALLALMRAARRSGLRVGLVNATVQAMDPRLLRDALDDAHIVHAREPATHGLLQTLGIAARCVADLAFLAIADEDARTPGAAEGVLVTAGVLARPETLAGLFAAVRAAGLEPHYLSIGDSREEQLAAAACAEASVAWTRAGELELAALPSFLRRFLFAISGRHHINVFLMQAGVPFLPLPSNSWKIEGTLELTGYPLRPPATIGGLLPALRAALSRREELAGAARAAFERGRESARAGGREFVACT